MTGRKKDWKKDVQTRSLKPIAQALEKKQKAETLQIHVLKDEKQHSIRSFWHQTHCSIHRLLIHHGNAPRI